MSILGTVGSAAKFAFGVYHWFSQGRGLLHHIKSYNTIMKNIETIGTHDGTFHCDEVLGCAMLRLLYPNAKIVRSRKEDVLDKCDIVIDVGGIYDAEKYRFDHHQKGFEVTGGSLLPGKPWNIKLSSAGLVYCHFGKDILRCVVNIEDEKSLDKVFDKVYENVVLEVDGIDNGIPMCCAEPKYWVSSHLSARVARLNKGWNQTEFDETKAFEKAMELVIGEFKEQVRYFAQVWLAARSIVESSVQKRFEIDSSGEVIELEQFCPWKAHYFDLEAEMQLQPTVKYAIFCDGVTWRVQAVSLDANSFILRVPLLKEWQGLRGSDIKGVEGAIFVHGTGFIGGNETREGALFMARKSLEGRPQ